jgi:hypothetical protein
MYEPDMTMLVLCRSPEVTVPVVWVLFTPTAQADQFQERIFESGRDMKRRYCSSALAFTGRPPDLSRVESGSWMEVKTEAAKKLRCCCDV